MADGSRLAGEIVREGDCGSAALGLVGRDNGKGELAELVAKGELLTVKRVDCDSHASFKLGPENSGGFRGLTVSVIGFAKVRGKGIRVELGPFDFLRGGRRLGGFSRLGDGLKNASSHGIGHWFGFQVVAVRYVPPTIEG